MTAISGKDVIDPSCVLPDNGTSIASTVLETPTKVTLLKDTISTPCATTTRTKSTTSTTSIAPLVVDKLTLSTPETMSTISSSCVDPSWSTVSSAASSNSTLASPSDNVESSTEKVLFKCLLPPGGVESLHVADNDMESLSFHKKHIMEDTTATRTTQRKECITQPRFNPSSSATTMANVHDMTSPESWSTISLSHKDSPLSMPRSEIVRTQSLLDWSDDEDDDEDNEEDQHDYDTIRAGNTNNQSIHSSLEQDNLGLDTSLPIDDELLKSMIQSAQYTLSEECTSDELRNLTRQMSQLDLRKTNSITHRDEEEEWEEELHQLNQSTKNFQKELDYAMDQVAYRHDAASYFSCLMEPPPHEALACGSATDDDMMHQKEEEEFSLMDRVLCCQDDFCGGTSGSVATGDETKGSLVLTGTDEKEDLESYKKHEIGTTIRPMDATGTVPQGQSVPAVGP